MCRYIAQIRASYRDFVVSFKIKLKLFLFYNLTIGAFGGAAQSTNSLFGGPSTSVFGAATTSAPAASGSLFGGQAQQSTGSVFGAASTTSAPASGSLFGGQAQQSTGK